ncbi:MAG: hypothetical protein LBQ12_08485 [Deltaproteobacteria bacterium]|jgi:hypothetical protein|nr:hypothetical protein [Deltaproteobacteria bacterium]
MEDELVDLVRNWADIDDHLDDATRLRKEFAHLAETLAEHDAYKGGNIQEVMEKTQRFLDYVRDSILMRKQRYESRMREHVSCEDAGEK